MRVSDADVFFERYIMFPISTWTRRFTKILLNGILGDISPKEEKIRNASMDTLAGELDCTHAVSRL